MIRCCHSSQLLLVLVFIGLASCRDMEASEADILAEELSVYVDSVEGLTDQHGDKLFWHRTDSIFTERLLEAKAHADSMSEDSKQKMLTAEEDYKRISNSYTDGPQPDQGQFPRASRQRLRDNFFGASKVGDDMKFDYVNEENIRAIYEQFVSTVEANKENYSKEEWLEIEALHNALNARRKELEKKLSTSDNIELAKLKVNFASIKASNRPEPEVRDNGQLKK